MLALRMHPLFWLPPIIGSVILLRNKKPFNRLYRNNYIWSALLILIVVTYLIRLILLFPYEMPLEFNDQGLIPRIISSLAK